MRVAVITGGAGALGAAVARELGAADVDRTALVDADEERLRDTEKRLCLEGLDVVGLPCDVADSASVARALERITGENGSPVVLVNAAGVPGRTGARPAAQDVSDEQWRHTLDVNLTGAFLWCRAVIPPMRSAAYGRIVNIASVAGRTASPTAALPYAVSKAGLLGLTRALAAELAPHGILVNSVAPSRIVNDNWPPVGSDSDVLPPIGRLARVDEVAAVVAFLASARNSYTTGAILDVNGARFVP
ncbi:MAG TPA: SDR family NAD(P)-dependent oxidoreductase [Mycobacteriales bacterium]|nr:SDR family NAD(P)-dependent oxidoreductase [Mycobacteriales bacterium]